MAVTKKRKSYLAKWRAKNRVKLSAINKKYREANREKTREANRKWRESKPSYFREYAVANRDSINANYAKWLEKNREAQRKYHREYQRKNKKRIKAQAELRGEPVAARIRAKEWSRKNPERKKELARRYWEINHEHERARLNALDTPERKRENLARYRARKENAMPTWLTTKHKAQIRSIYAEATKRGLEVDHAVPIRSKIVCGLHVPWNLQLLTPNANKTKSNRLPPQHECIAPIPAPA